MNIQKDFFTTAVHSSILVHTSLNVRQIIQMIVIFEQNLLRFSDKSNRTKYSTQRTYESLYQLARTI
jgi:hypothetical protein